MYRSTKVSRGERSDRVHPHWAVTLDDEGSSHSLEAQNPGCSQKGPNGDGISPAKNQWLRPEESVDPAHPRIMIPKVKMSLTLAPLVAPNPKRRGSIILEQDRGRTWQCLRPATTPPT